MLPAAPAWERRTILRGAEVGPITRGVRGVWPRRGDEPAGKDGGQASSSGTSVVEGNACVVHTIAGPSISQKQPSASVQMGRAFSSKVTASPPPFMPAARRQRWLNGMNAENGHKCAAGADAACGAAEGHAPSSPAALEAETAPAPAADKGETDRSEEEKSSNSAEAAKGAMKKRCSDAPTAERVMTSVPLPPREPLPREQLFIPAVCRAVPSAAPCFGANTLHLL